MIIISSSGLHHHKKRTVVLLYQLYKLIDDQYTLDKTILTCSDAYLSGAFSSTQLQAITCKLADEL